MKKVSFDRTTKEDATLAEILDRAARIWPNFYAEGKAPRDRLWMDLAATHANGCPMDFEKLLAVEDFTFMHDIDGITRHMNRKTGKLGDHFRPRCARQRAA